MERACSKCGAAADGRWVLTPRRPGCRGSFEYATAAWFCANCEPDPPPARTAPQSPHGAEPRPRAAAPTPRPSGPARPENPAREIGDPPLVAAVALFLLSLAYLLWGVLGEFSR